VADVGFVADFSGALFWEAQSLLVVSDLHLEKGSSFASRGVLLPPYDTVATLSRLAAVIARHDAGLVAHHTKYGAVVDGGLERARGRIAVVVVVDRKALGRPHNA